MPLPNNFFIFFDRKTEGNERRKKKKITKERKKKSNGRHFSRQMRKLRGKERDQRYSIHPLSLTKKNTHSIREKEMDRDRKKRERSSNAVQRP